MNKILLFLSLISSTAFAVDRPIPCTGNSCKILIETVSSGGAKVSVGKLDANGFAVTNTTGATGIGSNLNFDSVRNFDRLNTAANGGAVVYDANTSAASSAVSFFSQPPGGSPGGTTGTVQSGFFTGQSNWVLGPASGGAGTTLSLRKSGGASFSIFPDNAGSTNTYSLDNNAGTLRFYNHAAQMNMTLSQSGALTVGPTSGSGLPHNFNSGAGTTVSINAGGTSNNSSLLLNASLSAGTPYMQYQRGALRVWETGVDAFFGTDSFYFYNGSYRMGITSAGALKLPTPLAIADGGTGAATAAAARTNLGVLSQSLWVGSTVCSTGAACPGSSTFGSNITSVINRNSADNVQTGTYQIHTTGYSIVPFCTATAYTDSGAAKAYVCSNSAIPSTTVTHVYCAQADVSGGFEDIRLFIHCTGS